MVEDVLSVASERIEGCSVTEGCSCGRNNRVRAEGCGCKLMLLSVLKIAVVDVFVILTQTAYSTSTRLW